MTARERPLSAAMRSHLTALAAIAEGNYGEAYWWPETSGEWRCAEALVRRGLLRSNPNRGQQPFALTKKGYDVGWALQGGES